VPHDAHFLQRLDRITREHTEVALSLYRDHEAVRFLLERAGAPAEAPRVALAIGGEGKGPFVVVTRDGHFVTCLGEGMSTGGLPVVPRARLDALLAKLREQRSKRELVERALRPNEDEGELFGRVVFRGSRVAREDWIVLEALAPILGDEPRRLLLTLSKEAAAAIPALMRITKPTGDHTAPLESEYKLEWSVAHLMLLTCAGDRASLDAVVEAQRGQRIPFTICSSGLGGSTFMLRAAWAAARLGKSFLPVLRDALAGAEEGLFMMDAVMAIAAMGLRHAAAASEARRVLSPFAKAEATPLEKLRAEYARAALTVMDDVERLARSTLDCGRSFCRIAGDSLPEGHSLRFQREEDVPDDLALPAALGFDGNVFEPAQSRFTMGAVALAAKASAADFYFPRSAVRAYQGSWTPEEEVFRLERFRAGVPRGVPVRSEKKPGRNDPCPCGSGKKWKKCHGAGK
jgi:SEC-C motif-containing protein